MPNIYVCGVGATSSSVAKMKTHVMVLSKFNSEFSLSVPMLIMDKLTTDPSFCRPSQIDCILGADVYGTILVKGIIRDPPNTPIAQKSQFETVGEGGNKSMANNRLQSLHIYIHHGPIFTRSLYCEITVEEKFSRLKKNSSILSD